LSVFLSVVLGGLLYAVRDAVVAAYSSDPAVRATALGLFIYIAAYQVFDATQVTAAFALRSMRVALLPAIAYAVSLWGLGLAGGYVLGFDLIGSVPPALQGASGFWLGNASALGVVSIALLLLYHRVSRRYQRDAVSAAAA
jgi:MATE family multidrug resistance protein